MGSKTLEGALLSFYPCKSAEESFGPRIDPQKGVMGRWVPKPLWLLKNICLREGKWVAVIHIFDLFFAFLCDFQKNVHFAHVLCLFFLCAFCVHFAEFLLVQINIS